MQLTKIIPAHTETVEFTWCKKEWLPMSPEYRKARANMSPMDSCFWCEHEFINGEMLVLAQPKSGLNRVLCQTCAEALLSSV